MWKSVAEPDRDWPQMQYNTAHTLCMLSNSGYRPTLRICNSDCFSTATMNTRTRLNVTLYIHYLSCLILVWALTIRKYCKIHISVTWVKNYCVVCRHFSSSILHMLDDFWQKAETLRNIIYSDCSCWSVLFVYHTGIPHVKIVHVISWCDIGDESCMFQYDPETELSGMDWKTNYEYLA